MFEERCQSHFSEAQSKVLSGKPGEITQDLHPEASSHHELAHFVFIDLQRLWWECLSQVIGQHHPDVTLAGYTSVEDYLSAPSSGPHPDAVILHAHQSGLPDIEVHGAIKRLVKAVSPVPVVVLADHENIDQMISALDYGVSGYIPASIGLQAMVETMKTAASGGFLLTSHGLDELRQLIVKKPQPSEVFGDTLTSRQSEVAEALREGKSNKTIAYELDMRENTVKVHVRNILKRLQVTNRTEAALKLNETNAAY